MRRMSTLSVTMFIVTTFAGQFGSVVASYFTFLRWVFWINTFISIFICVFLMVPEVLRNTHKTKNNNWKHSYIHWTDTSWCPGSDRNEERSGKSGIGTNFAGHLGLRGLLHFLPFDTFVVMYISGHLILTLNSLSHDSFLPLSLLLFSG